MSIRWAPLRQVLRLAAAEVSVVPGSMYPMVGVLGHGRGLLLRETIRGADTSYKTLRRMSTGQIVYSRLKAFEGAFAVVRADGDGRYASGEFPNFDIDRAQVSVEWLGHLLHTAWFRARVTALSKGIGARRERLGVDQFLQIEIPLPDLDTQREIAARLDRYLAVETRAREVHFPTSALEQSVWRTLANVTMVKMGELVDQVERREATNPDERYKMLGVKWYGEGLFAREVKPGNEIKASSVYEVRSGDLVYNRLFAWKGSFAVAGPSLGKAFVSNEFPTFTVNQTLALPEYVEGWLRHPAVVSAVEAQSTGSTPTSRNRFKVDRFLALDVPLPDLTVQRAVADRLAQIQSAASLSRQRTHLMQAILPAARNEEFRKLLAS